MKASSIHELRKRNTFTNILSNLTTIKSSKVEAKVKAKVKVTAIDAESCSRRNLIEPRRLAVP